MLGWPLCSDAYDSGAAAVAYLLNSTLLAKLVPIKAGTKVQRASGQIQGIACHSSGKLGMKIAGELEAYASFRDLMLQGS
jgi:hypothetical protein